MSDTLEGQQAAQASRSLASSAPLSFICVTELGIQHDIRDSGMELCRLEADSLPTNTIIAPFLY
jgi:hypothetical protein